MPSAEPIANDSTTRNTDITQDTIPPSAPTEKVMETEPHPADITTEAEPANDISVYAGVLQDVISRADPEGGFGFLFDANEDGMDELFLLYVTDYVYLHGAVFSANKGQSVVVHPDSELCILAGDPRNALGVVSIDGIRYICAMGSVISTETTGGFSSAEWNLYAIKSDGFPLEKSISWKYSFEQWDSDVGAECTITCNGETMTEEEYTQFESSVKHEKAITNAWGFAYWIDDQSEDGYDGNDGIMTLEKLLQQCQQ